MTNEDLEREARLLLERLGVSESDTAMCSVTRALRAAVEHGRKIVVTPMTWICAGCERKHIDAPVGMTCVCGWAVR